MKRVLFVDHVSRILGGAEINLLELLAAAGAERRWLTACACPQGSRLSESVTRLQVPQWDYALPPGLNEFRLVNRRFDLRGALRSLRSLSVARQRLQAIAEAFQPDVMISCTNKDHFAAASVCRRRSVPSLWWVNDIVSPEFFTWPVRTAFQHKARRGATRVVTVSDYARQALVREGMPPRSVVTIHNGIPQEKYPAQRTAALRRQLRLEPDRLLIGIVGRFGPFKRHDCLIEAFARLAARRPDLHLLVVGGGGPEQERITRLARANPAAQRILLTGLQKEMAPCYQALDLLVVPSVNEGLSNALLEGMACGIPALCHDACGNREVVSHGEDGWVFDLRSAEELAIRLDEVLADPPHLRDLGRRAREKMLAHYSLEVMVRNYGRVYRELARRTE